MKSVAFLLAKVFIALVLGALTMSAASAQDGLDLSAETNYGELSLQAGFQPDPHIVTLRSGGSVDTAALNLGETCAGYTTSQPDFRLNWSGQGSTLRIFFASSGDTTLIVNDPQGRYFCNDDFDGYNPAVDFNNPLEGVYDIWVGSYNADEFLPGYLMITELNSTPGAVISSIITTVAGQNAPVNPPTTDNLNTQAQEQYFPNLSQQHTLNPVTYPQTPPVGGQHHPVWLNCGIYSQPVPNEMAVHSLEHGAVWITYDPAQLSADEVRALETLTRGGTHRLLSPYPGIPSRIVASAWGYQLRLQSADDPQLRSFIQAHEQAGPEPGAPCSGGEGTPLP